MKAKTRREPFYYIRFPACFELLLYCPLLFEQRECSDKIF